MGFFTTFWNFLQGNVLNTVSAITSNISASLSSSRCYVGNHLCHDLGLPALARGD